MLYYAQGDAIMTADEIFHPDVFDSLTGFFDQLQRGRTPRTINLPTGDLRAKDAGECWLTINQFLLIRSALGCRCH